jgi:Trypsin-like peptidase domain
MGIILKLFYSLLLVGLSGILLRELWTVWFDTTIYIGRFDVVSEAGKDDSASAIFPKRIVGAQAILAQQFNDYQTRRTADAPSDATYVLPGMTPLLLPPEVLAGIDITVQNINVRQVLTAIRRTFLAPNEVVGNVAVREGSVLAAIDWPRAPLVNPGQPRQTKLLVPGQPNEQAAAAYVAGSLSWARAASLDTHIAAYPRAQFCDFGAALNELYVLGEKASSPSGLDAKETALVRKHASQLRTHYDADTVFPELYRLRADLLDLLPEGERKQAELVEAQEDRLRYAMLSPKLSGLPDEEKRLTALALARPAIVIDGGRLSGAPENWASLLRRHDPEIRLAAASIGLILSSDGTPLATGFIVAPRLMMTAKFVLDTARFSPRVGSEANPTADRLRLCLGSSKSSCDPSLTIGDVIYRGDAEGSKIVLVNLENHDIILNPPLPFADPLPAPNAIVGQYAFVIGYPFRDPRMPPVFIDHLLGKDDGRKRLMPGRILAFGQGGPNAFESKHPAPPVFTIDMSTTGGTAGAPLMDLTTGRVIGMNFAGVWKGERGKFAYAESTWAMGRWCILGIPRPTRTTQSGPRGL